MVGLFSSAARRLAGTFTAISVIGVLLIALPIATRRFIDLSGVHEQHLHDVLTALPCFLWAVACGSFAAILSALETRTPRALFLGARYVNETLWLLVRALLSIALCTVVAALPLLFLVPKGPIVKDVAFLAFLTFPLLVATGLALVFAPTYFIAVSSIIARKRHPFATAFARTFARAVRRRTLVLGFCMLSLLFAPLALYAYVGTLSTDQSAIAIASAVYGLMTALATAYCVALAIAYDGQLDLALPP